MYPELANLFINGTIQFFASYDKVMLPINWFGSDAFLTFLEFTIETFCIGIIFVFPRYETPCLKSRMMSIGASQLGALMRSYYIEIAWYKPC